MIETMEAERDALELDWEEYVLYILEISDEVVNEDALEHIAIVMENAEENYAN